MHDHEVAIKVTEAGAAIVRECFGTALQRMDKGGGDFATHVDVQAENTMLSVLRRERPEDSILGEESGKTEGSRDGRTWLIDPLCGTLNYAAGMRVVAVNVALRVGALLTAAAVADPFNHEVFWTDGVAAYRRLRGAEDSQLVPSGESKLVDLNFDPPFPNAPGFSAFALAANPGFAARFRPRVVSTSLALAWVATGQRAAYVTDGDVRDSVHFAAGIAICRAAGCIVTDLHGNPCGAGPRGLLVAADRATRTALLALARNDLS